MLGSKKINLCYCVIPSFFQVGAAILWQQQQQQALLLAYYQNLYQQSAAASLLSAQARAAVGTPLVGPTPKTSTGNDCSQTVIKNKAVNSEITAPTIIPLTLRDSCSMESIQTSDKRSVSVSFFCFVDI